MTTRKNSVPFILSLCMVLLLAACSANTSTNEGSDNTGANSTEPAGSVEQSWAEENGLNKTETVEELYAKAKEEGEVNVYSMSGRTASVKDSFEKQYPGITVNTGKINSVEMLEKVTREHAAKIFNMDVMFTKDTAGAVTTELLGQGIVHKYMPEDIIASMPEPYKSFNGLIPYVEARGIFYNADVYPTPPVTNWWDLTTPEWKSRIMISDPLSSADTMDLFLAFVQNSDDMAQAYKEKFGEDIVLDGTENAGYEFIKRLNNNDVVIMNDSSDMVIAIGAKGQAKPPIGLAVSTKLREAKSEGINLGVSYDVKPKVSHAEQALLFIGDQSKHPNAAKLFIRWMLGEADGKGAGMDPFNLDGSWPTRTDIKPVEQLPINELNVWEYDPVFNYANVNKVRDFWLIQQ